MRQYRVGVVGRLLLMERTLLLSIDSDRGKCWAAGNNSSVSVSPTTQIWFFGCKTLAWGGRSFGCKAEDGA